MTNFRTHFRILGLSSLLWLVGCASTAISTSSPTSADTTTSPQTSTAPAGAPDTSAVSKVPATPVPGAAISTQTTGPDQNVASAQVSSRSVALTQPPADLWERIRRGFAMPDLEHELVRDREQWYVTRPDYIFRMTERSRKYLFHIVEELERRDMPTELALLPFIESAFNPQAVSSAKAAGMWQFMPATGKHFELRQNVFRDDRRDVLASTRAALDYLQKLHNMFGDWHLALAAYNWGEGSVARAIAKNKRAGLGTYYAALGMPAETRLYVPKLQAVKNIVANPQNFNARLPDIENHPYFQSVDITRDLDVALAAQLAEIPLEDFKALNPSANRPVILAAGTPQILLPWDNAIIFQTNLKARSNSRLASWTAWTAPSTMKVADAAKRVGMHESQLMSINNIPPRMLIKVGSTLLVPRSEGMSKDVSEHVADNGHMALAPEVVLRRSTLKARKGESVATIAKRYKVSAASVAEWNKVGSSAIFKTGQQIVVFLPARAKQVARIRSGTNNMQTIKTARRAVVIQKKKRK
ncbi:MAG TPA: transglycosylase SLT domain-containing protein [Burkholderiaceae bacterium]|nr:transglycosylase SLT domain-containing protein [Burkholderiaceae bacterium]